MYELLTEEVVFDVPVISLHISFEIWVPILIVLFVIFASSLIINFLHMYYENAIVSAFRTIFEILLSSIFITLFSAVGILVFLYSREVVSNDMILFSLSFYISAGLLDVWVVKFSNKVLEGQIHCGRLFSETMSQRFWETIGYIGTIMSFFLLFFPFIIIAIDAFVTIDESQKRRYYDEY